MGSERLGGHLIALFTAYTPADTHPNATIKLNKAFAELSLVFSFTCRMFYCNSAEVVAVRSRKKKKKRIHCLLPVAFGEDKRFFSLWFIDKLLNFGQFWSCFSAVGKIICLRFTGANQMKVLILMNIIWHHWLFMSGVTWGCPELSLRQYIDTFFVHVI